MDEMKRMTGGKESTFYSTRTHHYLIDRGVGVRRDSAANPVYSLDLAGQDRIKLQPARRYKSLADGARLIALKSMNRGALLPTHGNTSKKRQE
jgi:hypothetical protein